MKKRRERIALLFTLNYLDSSIEIIRNHHYHRDNMMLSTSFVINYSNARIKFNFQLTIKNLIVKMAQSGAERFNYASY